jgi:C1A family cysteine protease
MSITSQRHSRTKGKIRAFLLSLILMFVFVVPESISAADEVKVSYNGNLIVFNQTYGFPFIDENERTQVPFRIVMEAIGANVTWNQASLTAVAVKDGVRVEVPIGEKYILRNGAKIVNDTNSRVVKNRTYLPIRIVFEAFDIDVTWDATSFTVVAIESDEPDLFTSIPIKYDLRQTGRITPVKTQFDTGACWAFASFGAMESTLMPNEKWDFSEDHLSLSHGFDLDQAEGGNYAISLSYLTRWSGPVIEEDDIFNDGSNNPDAVPVKHLQEAQFIPNKDYAGIKIGIMNNGAMQTSIFLDATSLSNEQNYYNPTTASYFYFGKSKVNHDVVIVGWDDTYPKSNFKVQPKRNGAFIVKNSYGTDFGKEGYFYISYEDLNVGTRNVMFTQIDDTDNYDNIYQSDWLGFIGQIGYGEDTAYFANVYQTNGKELLKAVSFYATDQESTYEIYVVDKFTATSDYKNKKLVKKGSFDYGGYYTIDFETPILVDGLYSIIVKIRTPGSMFPVAAEFNNNEPWVKSVDTSDGRGYMSYDGITWDRTEDVLKANVCLKAFTYDYDIALLDQSILLSSN